MSDDILMMRTASIITLAVTLATACAGSNAMSTKGEHENTGAGDIPKEARDELCSFLGFAEITIALAAPRVMAKASRMASRVELVRALDDYLASIARAKLSPPRDENRQSIAGESHVKALRDLVAAWEPSKDVPNAIKLAARAALIASGAAEPPEGWDRYEGETEHK